MKPLELTVYPRPEHGPFGMHDWQLKQAIAKRFTDAELAAEYWQSFSEIQSWHCMRNLKFADDCRREHLIINRFATLPHYDSQETP